GARPPGPAGAKRPKSTPAPAGPRGRGSHICCRQMVDISESLGMRTASAERTATRSRLDHDGIGRAVDFTDRQIAVLFAVLATITVIPIILYPWPPLPGTL